jgi:uncharacterized protein YmfQ (DUF2313 family)
MSTAAEYREQLKALLPPGQAFPRDSGTTLHDLLDGMSIELARVDDRASALPLEVNPNTTLELLPDWERVAGLPDKCSGILEETLQGRRNALLAKLTSTGGQSADYFIQLAASLGYAVTIEVFRPFRAGRSVAGDVLSNGAWAFAWRIHAPDVTVIPFRAGLSVAGERLRVWGSDTLECKIRQLAPAHTIPIFAYGDATLDLNFVLNTYRAGANNLPFAGLITFTRSTTAGRFNAAGLFEMVPINQPRFDYDPVTLAPLGLLMEEARTNIALHSTSLNTGWNRGSGAGWADGQTFIDGTATAVLATGLAGTTISAVGTTLYRTLLPVTAGGTYTYTLFAKLKTASATPFRLRVQSNASGTNFQSDTPLSTTGWTRATVTFTVPAGDTTVVILAGTLAAAIDVYLGGVQLELGASATSYIPTLASQVTRALDVATLNNLAPWYNPVEGTLFARATNLVGTGTAIAQLGLTSTDRIFITAGLPGVAGTGGISTVGGVTQAQLNATLGANDQRVAFGFKANDFACTVNGTLVGVDGSGSIPPVTALRIARNGTISTNCYIRQITYSPKRLSNARLAAMTAP